MSDGFSIRLESKELDRYLTGMDKRGVNKRPFFTFCAGIISGSIADNFSAQGRPDPWTELKKSTLDMKRRHMKSTGSGDILFGVGTLYAKAVQHPLIKITNEYLEYSVDAKGTELKKIFALQKGRDKINPMVAREYMLFQKGDIKQIVARAAAYFFGDL